MTESLGGSGGVPTFDGGVHGPGDRVVDGDSMAAEILRETRSIAEGLDPKLAVVSVGRGAEGHTSPSATFREAAAPPGQSWFNKRAAGARFGIAVDHVDLPEGSSTADVIAAVRSAARSSDGIQLMWPLPPQVDAAEAYAAVPPSKDVDGAHYVGLSELREGTRCGAPDGGFLPVTPGAVMEVLRGRGVDLASSRVVVIGRSRIVGSPLAHALVSANATVTVAHSYSRDLESLCRDADVVISCAGVPGLVKPGCIWAGAGVVSVGVTFSEGSMGLVSDLDGRAEEFDHAGFVATAPGGVGPLSLAVLMRNVAEAARRRGVRQLGAGDDEPRLTPDQVKLGLKGSDWEVRDESIVRVYDLKGHLEAAALIERAGGIGDSMDHHVAKATVDHRCEKGVRVTFELFTTSTGGTTKFDVELANALDEGNAQIRADPDPDSGANVAPTMGTKEFIYDLPQERIAAYPTERGMSRLLVHVPENPAPELCHFAKQIREHQGDKMFSDIVDVMSEHAHLVFNESRVFEARVRSTEGTEVLFLSPMGGGALKASAEGQTWKVMVRSTAGVGSTLNICDKIQVKIEQVLGEWIEEGEDDGIEAAVSISGDKRGLDTVLKEIGEIPLPPYLNRKAEEADQVNYQTVYSKEDLLGSVAAPTAGLHFTEEVLAKLEKKGVNLSKVCLHVGAGTFKPMKEGQVSDHAMHDENFSVSVEELDDIMKSVSEGRPIVAVGTTSVRVLESLYWLESAGWGDGNLGQWEAYRREGKDARVDALAKLRDRAMRAGGRLHGTTQLCIAPGYDFKMVDAAVTNFHAPDSTLMMLVAALVGGSSNIKNVYGHAVENKYRFLSYGDSCLLLRGVCEKSTDE